MRKSELTRLLSSASEEEVFIKIDGVLYDIAIEHEPETFDGFYTAFEASLSLVAKEIDV